MTGMLGVVWGRGNSFSHRVSLGIVGKTNMPPKPTLEKAAKFKNRLVGDICDEEVKKEIKQLPDDLKKLWSNRNFKEFLEKALKKLEDGGYNEEKKLSDSLLVILPTLAFSDDKGVHELIQNFYFVYTHEELGSFTDSRYEYVHNVVYVKGMEKSKYLVPSEWIEEVCPDDMQEKILTEEKNSRAKELKDVRENLIDFPKGDADVMAKLTLNVEAQFSKECRKATPPKEGSILLNVAAKFVEWRSSCFFKLNSSFPKCPGVYFLYFVDERELYKDTQIYGSKYKPVYVGMSTTDISLRLADHRSKIEAAKDLIVADFAVNTMFVDNRHYAPCIEGLLIEHFKPIWNKETVGLCFGAGTASLWKKIHVDQDVNSRTQLLGLLQIASSDSSSNSEYSSEGDSSSSSPE